MSGTHPQCVPVFGRLHKRMAVETELLDGLVIARLNGDIDHHGAKTLRETIDDAVISAGARELELDFREVAFMDSSGIGLVMGRYKLMQELNGRMWLVNVAAHLKKVMVLAGLDRLSILDRPPQRGGKEGEHGEADQLHETAV